MSCNKKYNHFAKCEINCLKSPDKIQGFLGSNNEYDFLIKNALIYT